MTPPLATILAPLDRAAVERERDRLREELADYEALLRLISRHGAGSDMPSAASTPPADRPDPASRSDGNGNGSNGKGHKPRSQRDVVLAILAERPGRWTTAEIREALEARGHDPRAGTPVKNIMWQLARIGKVTAAGSGVYEYPPTSTSPDDPRVQEAMGL